MNKYGISSHKVGLAARAIALLFVGCLSVAFSDGAFARKMKKSAETKTLSAVTEERFRALYLESVVQREKNCATAQYELLCRALKLKPDAPEALFDLAQVAQQGDVLKKEEITALYRKAIEGTGGENVDYLEAFATYAIETGDYDEAIPVLQKLVKNELKRETAYQMLTSVYEGQQRYDDLLKTIEEWERTSNDDEEIENLKIKALDRMKRYDEEIKVIEKLIRENPDNDYYPIARAQALLQKGDTVNSWAGYRAAVEKDSNNLSAQMFRVVYCQVTKNEEEMMKAMEAVILNNKQPTEMRVSLMRGLMTNLKGTPKEGMVERLFGQVMEQPLTDRDLPELCVQYLSSKNEPDSAFVPAMKRLLELDPTDDQARLVLIQDALNHRAYASVKTQCEEGIKIHPSKLLYYHLCGGALYQQGNHGGAVAVFEKGLPYVEVTKDKDIVSNFYSSYADALHETAQREKSYAYYDSALVYNPSNVVTLNNYAYFLSVDGQRLELAQQMSMKVLKIEPDNPVYIDTYAWILFQQKDYKQACTYMEQALRLVKDEKEDAGLYEHAGDIYIHLGQKQQARQSWQKALELGPASTVLQKKIKTLKYYRK